MEEIMKDRQQAQQGQKPLPTPRKVRGTMTIKSEDDMEFRADRHTGISSQEQISKFEVVPHRGREEEQISGPYLRAK